MWWKPYVSPDVWVMRCQSRIGSATGTVSGFVAEPRRYTRASANAGMNRATGSVSWNAPSSKSIIAATVVTGFVIE